MNGTSKIIAGAIGVAVALGAIFGIVGVTTSLTKADGGEVIVVRNGGLFDANDFRQIVRTEDGLTMTGLWSTNHSYPASQRNFVVSASEGADSNETINVPTSDGVTVGIEGTFYFTLNQDAKVLENFDNAFGLRKFGPPDNQKYAWGDDEGWRAFLDFTLGKTVQNVLRQEISTVRCDELISSCALANNPNATITEGQSAQTLDTIQQKVNEQFAKKVTEDFGGPIFVDINFTLASVKLPQVIQDRIDAAQAANAGTAQANAEAAANKARQDGYNACPVCGEIDRIKAIPGSITVWAPGSEAAVPVR